MENIFVVFVMCVACQLCSVSMWVHYFKESDPSEETKAVWASINTVIFILMAIYLVNSL